MTIAPICVPEEWGYNGSVLFKEFCALIRTPQRAVRERRRHGRAPTWHRFNGNGNRAGTVDELRSFLTGGR